MLILTRKPGESLFIGDGVIKVTLVEIKGNQVRLGISASPDIKVYREEIYNLILEENRKAAEGVLLNTALDELSGGWNRLSQRDGGGEAKRSMSPVRAQSPDGLVRRRSDNSNSPKGEVKKES